MTQHDPPLGRIMYCWSDPPPLGSFADDVPRPHALTVVVHADGIFDLTAAEYAQYLAAKAGDEHALTDYLDDLIGRLDINVTAIEPDGTKVTADKEHAGCVDQLEEARGLARTMWAALDRVATGYADTIGYDPRTDIQATMPPWLTAPER